MQIKIFTDDGLAALKAGVKANAKHYITGNKAYFDSLIATEGYATETVFKVPDLELITREPLKAADSSNVRIIHNALRGLPKRLLAKEALWAELAHDELWDYVQFRQVKKLKGRKLDKIEQTYFFTTGFKRSLFLRLFEKGMSGKAVLFSSSNFTSNKNVSLGILDAIAAKHPSGNEVERIYFTEATKHLNSISGVTLLDAIPREEIAQRVMTHFEQVGL